MARRDQEQCKERGRQNVKTIHPRVSGARDEHDRGAGGCKDRGDWKRDSPDKKGRAGMPEAATRFPPEETADGHQPEDAGDQQDDAKRSLTLLGDQDQEGDDQDAEQRAKGLTFECVKSVPFASVVAVLRERKVCESQKGSRCHTCSDIEVVPHVKRVEEAHDLPPESGTGRRPDGIVTY